MEDRFGRPGRFHESDSEWLRSFALDDLKVLVVCRGPVRKEAFGIFDEMGIASYGMLLSEQDSVVYPRCLAPELREISGRWEMAHSPGCTCLKLDDLPYDRVRRPIYPLDDGVEFSVEENAI